MKERIFSGIQPSGRLHIGNYLGAIKNWIPLQEKYECVWGIVDYHAITVRFKPEEMHKRILECAINYIASGLNPEKSILMLQSLVPEHTELAWILGTVAPVQDLMRVPTYKEKTLQNKDNVNMGLLSYPILMAADILIYKSVKVPVGEDQVPHIELTREIARRFNKTFGKTFPEPEEIVGKGARVLGLDGAAKMSKSLNNCIYLDESREEIWKKLAPAVTDTARKRRNDPGNPDICNIFSYHKIFSSISEIEKIREGCRTASIGCLDCKRVLLDNIVKEIAPIREKQKELWNKENYVKEVITESSKRARKIARETLREVKKKIGLSF